MELMMLGPLLLSVALMTLGESKMMGTMQSSMGPNSVGVMGMLQPMVDGLKLVLKETMMMGKSNKYMFMMVPMMNLMMSLMGYSMMGMGGMSSSSWWGEMGSVEMKNEVMMEQKNSMMMLLLMSSVGMMTMMLAGWSGNSKYAMMGSLSTTAQMMSYEMSMGLMMMSMMMMMDSMNMKMMVENQVSKHGVLNMSLWNMMSMWPMGMMMMMSSMAETNSAPMDLPEAESELVSGFMTEHSSFAFACFFLAEYSNMMLMCMLMSDMLLGGSMMTVGMMMYMFMWVSSSVPSLSYDQLMSLMWKGMLPLLLGSLSMEMCMLTSLA